MGDSEDQPSAPGGAGYWFTPVPIYLIEASIDPESPVNGPAIVLWAHLHRHYAWRRRMFPAHSTLAKETGQSDSAVRRQLNALRDAGALTWGANYSQRGRSSNDYALALQTPFDFDREVTVKNDSHPPVTVKSDGGVEVKSDGHPTVKNERVVEEHRVSEDSLSSPTSPAAQTPPAAGEREIDPLVQKLMTDHDATEDEATAVVAQVRRENRIKSLVSWANSATGALDIKQRLYEVRHRAAQPSKAAQPARPLPQWCGDLDCDEETRFRHHTVNGIPYSGPCHCHPDHQEDTAA